MDRLQKVLLSLSVLLLFPILFSTLIATQEVGKFPFELLQLTEYPWIGSYVKPYLFWGSFIFLVLLLIFLIVVLIWPMKKSLLLYEKGNGLLCVNKNAIQGFVATALDKESFIAQPKITVTMTKHKVNIRILGKLQRTDNVKQQSAQFIDTLELELRKLLGIHEEKNIAITLTEFKRKDKVERARVL